MTADVFIRFDDARKRHLICFRVLGDRFVGKWFDGLDVAANLQDRIAQWQSWPFLEGDDLDNAMKAEREFKERKK